jgi:hypothetical protein
MLQEPVQQLLCKCVQQPTLLCCVAALQQMQRMEASMSHLLPLLLLPLALPLLC